MYPVPIWVGKKKKEAKKNKYSYNSLSLTLVNYKITPSGSARGVVAFDQTNDQDEGVSVTTPVNGCFCPSITPSSTNVSNWARWASNSQSVVPITYNIRPAQHTWAESRPSHSPQNPTSNQNPSPTATGIPTK